MTGDSFAYLCIGFCVYGIIYVAYKHYKITKAQETERKS